MAYSYQEAENQHSPLRTPPLNSLRVFESVARLGNVALAAQELCVTPSAVSQQLRTIQLFLGVNLFEKRGRNLNLTEDGHVLHKRVSAALGEIHRGIKQIAAKSGVKPAFTSLTISLPQVFGASQNMAQHLFTFSSKNKHITTRVRSHNSFADIDWKCVDIAVINGNPPWHGFWWSLMRIIQLTPVCSPRILEGSVPLRHSSDLINHQLLHCDDGSNWRRWLAQVNSPLPSQALIYLDNFDIIIQLARNGNGIALVDEVTFANHLNCGSLVRPFAESIPAGEDYYFVQREGKVESYETRSFISWFLDDGDLNRNTVESLDDRKVIDMTAEPRDCTRDCLDCSQTTMMHCRHSLRAMSR